MLDSSTDVLSNISSLKKPKKTRLVKKKDVHNGYIVRIKYKCLITILSLLELSENEPGIYNRIRRTLPVHVLLNNLVD